MNRGAVIGSLLVLLVVATACGDDGGGSSASTETTTTTVAVLTDGDPGRCVNLEPCDALISRSKGLADGDVVQIRVTGWEPDGAVGIAQCADEADPDNPQGVARGPDGLPAGELCNVKDLPGPAQTDRADEAGVVAFEYEVVGGQRMVDASDAGVTCDATHDCVLNVFVSGANRFSPDAPVATFGLAFA
jgi:hypothetical protein